MRNAFPAAMNETALDHYQARKHIARYGHLILAMCACARLAVTAPPAARCLPGPAAAGPAVKAGRAPPAGVVVITLGENPNPTTWRATLPS
jgi:hypothetical protein